MAMTRGALFAAAGLCLAGLFAKPALAVSPNEQSARLDPRKVIEQSEKTIGRTLGEYRLADSTGAPVLLRDYRGKPLVISLIYTACSSVCPSTTQHLIKAVQEANRVFGRGSFNVLTLGFDARNDTPRRMAQFASIQGVKFDNWRMASADPATIHALLRDLGFSYVSVAGGFEHVTQTTVIDRDGKIYRHVYGDDFPIQMLIEPLKDVIYERSSLSSFNAIFDRIKYICTVYDPGAGRYHIDYSITFGSIMGGLSLLIFGGLIYREWVHTERA
jgi:protein SCO1/2